MTKIFKLEIDFPIKADITKTFSVEDCINIYKKQYEMHADQEPFSVIDGPPYANGLIHLGHTVNKIQKAMQNQFHYMLGRKVAYIPGFDCHGLPIEKKVELELKAEMKDPKFDIKKIDPILIRERCRKFAQYWVESQTKEFCELGVFGAWEAENIFTTMEHCYSILKKFHTFVKAGFVYRGVKPVMWSIAEQTSMANAEIEYKQHESLAVDIGFEVQKSEVLPENCVIIIWTTTPWTLPGNRAICYSNDIEYVLVELPATNKHSIRRICVAEKLLEEFLKRYDNNLQIEDVKIILRFSGEKLKGTICKHPLNNPIEKVYDFDVPLIAGAHVTAVDGTGFVHTAPAHGEEDFSVGKKHNLEIVNVITQNGVVQNAPGFNGLNFKEAPKAILSAMQDKVYSQYMFLHNYPYSWRSHTPLIYIVTPQWYIKMDHLKKVAEDYANKTKWVPESSKNRFYSMLIERADWCVSRQRTWGVPLALFIGVSDDRQDDRKNDMQNAIFDCEVLDATYKFLENKHNEALNNGSSGDFLSAWWIYSAEEILGSQLYHKITEKYGKIEKMMDVLDVWFDSGSMQYCLQQSKNALHREINYPTDLYLEGSDQHRGFFQACEIVNIINDTYVDKNILDASLDQDNIACNDGDVCSSKVIENDKGLNNICSSDIFDNNIISNTPPAKAIITHGFLMDAKGRKMSKSLGNIISPQELLKEYGLDAVRLWVAMTDCTDDIKYSKQQMDKIVLILGRFRNTLRYLLGSLHDFSDDEALPVEQWYALDQSMYERVLKLQQLLLDDISKYQTRGFYEELYLFCDKTLSSFYIDINKDVLYCDTVDNLRRRSVRSCMKFLLVHLIKWLSPVIQLTANEAWRIFNEDDVFFEKFDDHKILPRYKKVEPLLKYCMEIKDRANQHIEQLRREKIINQTLQAKLDVLLEEKIAMELKTILKIDDLAEFLQFVTMTGEVNVHIDDNINFIEVKAGKFEGEQCLRCRRFFANLYIKDGEKNCQRCCDI